MNFHFIRYLWNSLCVLYPLAKGSGITYNLFHKYRMKWKFIPDPICIILSSYYERSSQWPFCDEFIHLSIHTFILSLLWWLKSCAMKVQVDFGHNDVRPSMIQMYAHTECLFLSPAFSESMGTLNLICLSVPLSVCPSVTKTLTLLISSEVLMIEHWYLASMILVTSPFNWHHAVTLTFDLLQGQGCCRAGDRNSPNLLVMTNLQVIGLCIVYHVYSTSS